MPEYDANGNVQTYKERILDQALRIIAQQHAFDALGHEAFMLGADVETLEAIDDTFFYSLTPFEQKVIRLAQGK